MAWYTKIISTTSKLIPDFMKKEIGATWTPMYGADGGQRVTQSNLMDNNKNWVYVCVDKIADSVSAIPLKLILSGKNGKEEEIFDHEALDQLNKPNKAMSGRDFRYVTVAHQELTGNAYWRKIDVAGVSNLYPLNPKFISVVLSKDGMQVLNYKYKYGNTTIEIPETEIYHLKYPNPENPLLGKGTLEPIAEWVDVDNYATEFNRKFFINGAKFGGMIESEATTKEAMELIRIGVENQHKGVGNAHKIGVMPKGSKFTESSMTPKDMEFMEADARFRDKILAAFGVPKSVVGIVEDVNRANAESSNYVFMAFTVCPKMDRLITYLNEFYLPNFDGTENMYFTYKNPTPENQQIEIQDNQAALNSAPYMSVNEVRARKGLPPISGGDVVYGNPFLSPIGEPAPVDNTKTTNPTQHVKTDRKANAIKKISSKVVDLFKTKVTKDELYAEHKEFVTRVTVFEQKFAKIIKGLDQKQKQEVLENLKKIVKSQKAFKRADIFDMDASVAATIDLITPLMGELADDEGTRTMLKLGLASEFVLTSSRLEKILNASVKRMAKSYNRTTLDLLVSKISDGINAGEGIAKISDRVGEVYGLTEQYRAERVARTEVFSTANDASREAYVQSGVVNTVKWVTAEDELTCEFCAPLDGKIVDVNQSFFDKGQSAEGDDGGELALDYEKVQNPPLHPNCRCFIVAEEISLKSVKKEETVDLVKMEEDRFLESMIKMLKEDDEQKP